MPVHDPMVVRRQLGRHLRQMRDGARKSEADIDESCLMSRAKLWRIETGRVAARPGDVRALCWLYGADAETTDALSTLALGAKSPGYWEDFDDGTPAQFSLYRDLECVAGELRVYSPESVHALLQTPDYARAHWRGADPDITEQGVQDRMKLFQERQEAFHSRTPRPRLVTVLSDGALARLVDNRETMSDQIKRLYSLTRREQVDIRVLPWTAGAHPAMHVGPFTIMDFNSDDDPAVVCIETLTGTRYLERAGELSAYRRAFRRIYNKSRPVEDKLPTDT